MRKILTTDFFDCDAKALAQALLGKVIRVRYRNSWLCVMIIETEAYYLTDKGSHASLGFTQKRKALFMPAGTIYMYYARGGDSLNISAKGDGDAVLIKSAIPYQDKFGAKNMIPIMQRLNPRKHSDEPRLPDKLCSGQTLLCKSLRLKVPEWDQQQFDVDKFFLEDMGYEPAEIIQTSRLGIPAGRDEHLPYRFIDRQYMSSCTKKPKL